MPANICTAFALFHQRFGIEDKEPCFRVNVARFIEIQRLLVLRHDLRIKRVRLIQPLRVRLIQVATNYIFFRHWKIIVCLMQTTSLQHAVVKRRLRWSSL